MGNSLIEWLYIESLQASVIESAITNKDDSNRLAGEECGRLMSRFCN